MAFTNTFLTTTLPYINSNPHIGHSFEFILSNSISRFLKSKGPVHFNIGLDEHGLKVWSKAKELGISTESHIENLTKVWLDFCNKFEIEYDSFYKTSDASHHSNVQTIWKRFQDRGDIYKKSYVGKYCLGCESFKQDKELVDGKCTDHPTTKIQTVEEENYFFKLTSYKESLLEWLNNNTDFIQPQSKINELWNLIINAEDISISRVKENCPHGVEVPGDPSQIIYVWFDALFNYVFAAGYLTNDFKWDNVIQLCGPDNLRFQGVIFQAFLQSEGIHNTNKLLVHGTILDKDGRKISKTLGNVIDPIDQLEKYGLDAVKYYSLCGLSTYSDSGWNESELKILFNNDICNDWGNLVSRTLHLIDTKSVEIIQPTSHFKNVVDERYDNVESIWFDFRVKDALQKTNEIVKIGNKYINDEKPWNNDNYSEILNNLYYLITKVNKLYDPVFPNKCKVTDEAIKNKKKVILFDKII